MAAEHGAVAPVAVRAWHGGGEERVVAFVNLPNQFPVRLLYHTVAFENGQLRFLPDPYGWDLKVAQALGREFEQGRRPAATGPRPQRVPNDVGP